MDLWDLIDAYADEIEERYIEEWASSDEAQTVPLEDYAYRRAVDDYGLDE